MRRHAAPRALLLLLALSPAAHGQGTVVPAAAPDPAGARRAARRAQERFEQLRQRQLPSHESNASRCDVRVGRFCYSYDATAEPAPAEPPAITRGRDTLIAALGRWAAATPADGWIAGQHVRYLVEAGRSADAAAAAASCRASEPGWCASLLGLALHTGGRFAAAESAFVAAVAELPHDERCDWLDLRVLLGEELRRRYARAPCEERAALNERLWWLARPFLGSPGNDLRTEHYARLATARLYDDARGPYHPSWGRDAREVLVRYGVPTAWSRDRMAEARSPSPSGPRVTGHEPSPSYYFFPAARALEQPAAASADDWTLAAHPSPARYAPRYVRQLVELDHQWALFRRGDSTLAVAAYDLAAGAPARDTAFGGGAAEVALVLSRDERTAPVVARVAPAPARGTVAATAPWRPALVGVEALAPGGRGGARGRSGAGVRGGADTAGIAISDVLLLEPGAAPPASLAEALPRALPRVRARRGETIGLFWEVYGLAGHTDAVTVTLAVTRERASRVRRLGELLRVARRPAPVRMRWAARPDDPRQALGAGGVMLDLGGLAPGGYRIEVAVRTAAGDSTRAVRRVTVER